MKLKTIKEKTSDKEYTEYAFKEMGLIKSRLGINPNETMFFLGPRFQKDYFLCNGIIYVANMSLDFDPETKKTLPYTFDFIELYKIQLHKEYPKTIEDIDFEVVIMRDPRFTYTPDEFLNWIDSPCNVNHEIDNPYYEIITFCSKVDLWTDTI